MIKKILNITVWLVIIAFMVITLSFASSRQKEIKCGSVMISINDNTGNQFIDRKEVLELIKNKGKKLSGINFDKINISEIEKIILNHPSVKKANVFMTIDGTLHIEIRQRKPIIRIVKNNSESFYIDDQGKLMPLSEKYTARVLLANGNINEPFFQYYPVNIPEEMAEEPGDGLIQNLVYLAAFVDRDPFWRSQIMQVYVNERGEFELIPLVGRHTIILGTMENYRKKFRNLRAVYEQGFSKTGWNIYSIINLKFENQVICTRINEKAGSQAEAEITTAKTKTAN
jgi:cell division protein FtsQ